MDGVRFRIVVMRVAELPMTAGKRNESEEASAPEELQTHLLHDFDERCEERDARSVVEICKICSTWVVRSISTNDQNWSRPDRRNTTVAIQSRE